MKKEKILVVDNDPKFQRLLRAQLLAQEFNVHLSERGEDAILTTAEIEPDLILLDMNLPDITGMETCRRLREWTRTPIIALDGQEEQRRTVEVLDIGADDCVTKPILMSELLARIRAVLRRARDWAAVSAPATSLSFRNLTLDLVNRHVFLADRPLHLTPTEYELLRVMAMYAGRVLTHRELLTRIWGTESADDTQYLHVFVSQLRRKLEAHPGAPHHILTEPGIGYQFSADP